MAKVLIISQYYTPDITAPAFRIADLRRYLLQRNHEVDIITSYPHKAAINVELEDEAGLIRLKLPIGASTTFARLCEHSMFASKAVLAYLFKLRCRYDVVIATSPPLFVAPAAYLISKFARARYILDIRDIWPGSAVAAGVSGDSSALMRMASHLERWSYRVADHITCVSKPMKTYLEEFTLEDQISVVYNGVNSDPVPGNEIACSSSPRRWDSQSAEPLEIRLAYAGNLGLVQDVGILIEALEHVQPETRRRLRIRLIGGGVEKERLSKLAESAPHGAGIISFEGPYQKEVLNKVLRESADALFVHLRKDPILDRTIPSKVFDYCLLNLPIVYGLSGEGRDILGDLAGTLEFEQGSARSLATALDNLVEHYDELLIGAREHRKFVEEHFSRESCFSPFDRLLQ